MAKQKKAKFEECDPAVIFVCHLRAIDVAVTRWELIDIYKAMRRSIPQPFLQAIVISAIRERQEKFLDHMELPYGK